MQIWWYRNYWQWRMHKLILLKWWWVPEEGYLQNSSFHLLTICSDAPGRRLKHDHCIDSTTCSIHFQSHLPDTSVCGMSNTNWDKTMGIRKSSVKILGTMVLGWWFPLVVLNEIVISTTPPREIAVSSMMSSLWSITHADPICCYLL